MKYLFVDLEIIASCNENSIENQIEKVEYRASNKYLRIITDSYSNGNISEEEYRLFLEECYDYKDRVLEEVDDKYKGKINFAETYEINSFNQSMVNYVKSVSQTIDTYIIFYYNNEREFSEKKIVCEKYFSDCKVLGIPFYQESYNKDYRRNRTSKAEYIKNKLDLKDLEGCMLIDKSISSCNEFNNLEGISTLYNSPKNQYEDNSKKGHQLLK